MGVEPGLKPRYHMGFFLTPLRGVGKGGEGGAVAPPLLKAVGLSPSSFSHLRTPP